MAQRTGKREETKGRSARSGAGAASPRTHKTKAALERERKEREEALALFRKKCRIASVFLFAGALLLLLLVIFEELSPVLNGVLFGLLGWSVLPWIAVGFALSVILALDRPENDIKKKIRLFLIAGGMLSTFIHLCSPVAKQIKGYSIAAAMRTLYDQGIAGNGAGAFGGVIGALLAWVFQGVLLPIILLALGSFVFIMLVTGSDIVKLSKSVARPVKNATVRAAESVERAAEQYRAGAEERREERRRRAAFIDVPVDDEDEYDEDEEQTEQEEPETAAEPEQTDTYEQESDEGEELTPLEEIRRAAGGRGRKSKTPAVQEKTPEPEVPAESEIDEDEFERLLMRFSGDRNNKKQRQEELAKEVIAFAHEIKQQEKKTDNYVFPETDLLIPPEEGEGDVRDELRSNGERLVETLREYGVEASVVGISRGPAVTRYELKPAPGVKINRITALNKDIALRLAAKGVRIEAPIPGKAAVGVEIPNQALSLVRIRSLLESKEFREAKSPVTVTMGKDIEGNIVLADLAKMPHLLIAGATGMGKSVCINSMLMSLIYKSSPEDVRLIMVDPKSVELDVYNGLPHLLVPVVCDPKKAAGALQWAVTEMEKRYALLREQGVRNIDGYNKIAEQNEDMQKMSRIVIIIDEMADLMMTSPKEVENTISRLAAMARAAGMHMVLATQRPSVDIITGTIKANVPSRVAFAVASGVDSKIILDEGGAEELIGKGDMLMHPVGMAKPKRVQGCFVDDYEVEKVVSFIKGHCSADYDEEIAREIERNAAGSDDTRGGEGDEDFGDNDTFFLKAIDVVTEAGQASVSLLQRRLGVGYARAGRLVDQLESSGIVGPHEGSKPRRVLMSRSQYYEMAAMRESGGARPTAEPEQLRFATQAAAEVQEEPVQPLGTESLEELTQYAVSDTDGLPYIEAQPEAEPEQTERVVPHAAPDRAIGSILDTLPVINLEEDDADDDEDVPF